MKFYYAPNNNCYIELDARTHQTLELCINMIAYRLDSSEDSEMSMDELFRKDEPARLADKTIQSILTPEQYELYKLAPLY